MICGETMEVKKDYGILLERKLIDADIYVFVPKYIIEGELNIDIFIDNMGNEYGTIENTSTITADNVQSVGFIISEDELLKMYPNASISEAKIQYYSKIDDKVHFGFYIVEKDELVMWDVYLNEIVLKILNNQIKIEDNNLQIKLSYDSEDSEKTDLNNKITESGGDNVIAISSDKVKELLKINDLELLKKSLKQIYDYNQEITEYFTNLDTYEEFFRFKQNKPEDISKEQIIKVFDQSHQLFEEYKTLEEIREFLKYLIDLYTNLRLAFDKLKCDDETAKSKSYISDLITKYNVVLEYDDLKEIKDYLRIVRRSDTVKFMKMAENYENAKTYAKNKKERINIGEMRKYLDERVIGQEEAKTSIISAIVMNSITNNVISELPPEDIKRTCNLLIGPTGSGKTLITKAIGHYLNKPIITVDSTQVTVAGYVGANIEDYLSKLLEQTKGDLKEAEEGIIIFDEIDKKGTKDNGDVAGKGVLNSLLSFYQGTTYDITYNNKKYTFDTSRLTIFATGSFADIVKNNKAYKDSKIGFNSSLNISDQDIKYPKITLSDLSEYGNIPTELLGRIKTIIQLSGHTKESLKDCLLISKLSALLIEKIKLNSIGIELRWTEGYIDAIIEKALTLKTGARSLDSAVEESIMDARYEALANPDKYKAIILKKRTVSNSLDCDLMDKDGNTVNLKKLKPKNSKIKVR